MNHIELHEKLSKTLDELESGKIKPQNAKEYFNGCGKMINLCKTELEAIQMGADIAVPLLEIKEGDAEWVRTNLLQQKIKMLS
jgi:hypothetical protein